MLDFIWTLSVQLHEHGTSEHYKKILSTVGFEPPTSQGLQISSPPLSPITTVLKSDQINNVDHTLVSGTERILISDPQPNKAL